MSLKIRVIDSWGIIEWIRDSKPAVDAVRLLLEESMAEQARLLMSAINVGEVYYLLRKNDGAELAERWWKLSRVLPIVIDVPTLDDIWNAALLKSRYPISYADSFAAALTLKHRCPLVTGDPDFRSVDGLELEWIERL